MYIMAIISRISVCTMFSMVFYTLMSHKISVIPNEFADKKLIPEIIKYFKMFLHHLHLIFFTKNHRWNLQVL